MVFIFRGQNFNIEQISFLAVFIYTFFKILPSLQGLFSQFMVAKSNLDSLDVIYRKFKEFEESNKTIKKVSSDGKNNENNKDDENYDWDDI